MPRLILLSQQYNNITTLQIYYNLHSLRHEYDDVRHIETLIPWPKRPCIPCSHLRDKYNFWTIISTICLQKFAGSSLRPRKSRVYCSRHILHLHAGSADKTYRTLDTSGYKKYIIEIVSDRILITIEALTEKR